MIAKEIIASEALVGSWRGQNVQQTQTLALFTLLILLIYQCHYIYALIIVQRDATQISLFFILQVHSTCFGSQPHPSSGVHKTVTTASGTGHAVLCSYLPLTWPTGHVRGR